MKHSLDARRLLLDYLLGKLSSEERQATEERMLADQGFSDELREAEFDLIEDYHTRRLTADDHRRAERAFSQERLRDRPPMARPENGLHSHAEAETGIRSSRPWLRWSFAAAVMAICVVGGLFLALRIYTPQIHHPMTARRATPAGSSSTPSLTEGDTTAVVLLASDATRGEGGPTLELRSITRSILIQWAVPAGTRAQRFILSVSDNGNILTSVQQDGVLQEVDSRKVASFRLAPSAFEKMPAGTRVLMVVQSARDSPSSEAEYTVSVSRR